MTALPPEPFGIGTGRDHIRILPRFDGLELRFNRQVLHANRDLADLINFVLRSPDGPAPAETSDQLLRLAVHSLVALADAGVAPRIWGDWWACRIAEVRTPRKEFS